MQRWRRRRRHATSLSTSTLMLQVGEVVAGWGGAQMLKQGEQGEQGSGASRRMAVWLIAGSSLWPDLWSLQMACPGGLCPPSGA